MKKGFTLMEVLITVGIVGVVAAMTIPHMQSNVAKQQAGSGLMRAINTIENAFQLTMVNESIEKIPDFKNKTITEIF